jgi:uncharacterized protein YjbI with pentapeptide repeats
MILLPVTGASAYEVAAIDTSPTGTTAVQDTPTVDATVTALQKEQLAEQVEQLHIQNTWSTWTNLATPFTVLIGALTLLGGAWRYVAGQRSEREKQRELEKQQLADKQAEREKQAEARFQKVVEGLGSSNEATRVGSAILLRTFVHKDEGNERFYTQAFDLALAHLRLRPADPNTSEPLTPLSRALVIAFTESYPLARNWLNQKPQALDATSVQLDHAYLVGVDLRAIWMPGAYLRIANLNNANLSDATLKGADLSEASLWDITLNGANLANANLSEADLRGASLINTNLKGANLCKATLYGTTLRGADLLGADLSGASFIATNLKDVDLDAARSLKDTCLKRVKGLTATQLKAYQARGAIIDDAI